MLRENQRLCSGRELVGEQAPRAPLRVRMHAMVERVGRLLAQQSEAQAHNGFEIASPGAPDADWPPGVYADSPPM